MEPKILVLSFHTNTSVFPADKKMYQDRFWQVLVINTGVIKLFEFLGFIDLPVY